MSSQISITTWLDRDELPDFYRLLGKSRLDPDLAGLTAAVKAAARELLPYQNHADPTTARRAMSLLTDLGRVEGLLGDPVRLAESNQRLVAELSAQCAEHFVAEGANWKREDVRSWLEREKEISSAALGATLASICAALPQPPRPVPIPVRVFGPSDAVVPADAEVSRRKAPPYDHALRADVGASGDTEASSDTEAPLFTELETPATGATDDVAMALVGPMECERVVGRIAATFTWTPRTVDRLLAYLTGGKQNVIVHTFFRVVSALVLLIGPPWWYVMARSNAEQRRRHLAELEGLRGEASAAETRARRAKASADESLTPAFEPKSYSEAERLLEQGATALEEARFAEAQRLSNEAAKRFVEAQRETLQWLAREAESRAQEAKTSTDALRTPSFEPPSYSEAERLLDEATVALEGERLVDAKRLFDEAAERYAEVQYEKERFSSMQRDEVERMAVASGSKAREAHAAARSLLTTLREPPAYSEAERLLAEAATAFGAERFADAARLADRATSRFTEARETLEADSQTLAELARRIRTALAMQDPAVADKLLARIEELSPREPRLASWQRELDDLRPGPEVAADLTNSIGMKFRNIHAGWFHMGQNDGHPDERPVRRVQISRDFYLGIYEVTQAQYRQIMDEAPKHKSNGDHLPVTRVSSDDVTKFCRLLTEQEHAEGHLPIKSRYRLPTEAEWEYAARAGTTTKWCCGDDDAALDVYAWYVDNSGYKVHPVGRKRPNAWGLFDMHGNVSEFCSDLYPKPWPGKRRKTEVRKVVRGGNESDSASNIRSAKRGYRDSASGSVGFRVARTYP